MLMGHCGEIHVFSYKLRTNHHFFIFAGIFEWFLSIEQNNYHGKYAEPNNFVWNVDIY